MIRRSALLVLVFAASGAGTAPAAALPSSETQSLEAFAAANASCHEWSDGCVVCVRRADAGFACSTPGIACTPSPLACRSPAPPATPAKP